MARLAGKVAIVTGATSGLGAASAVRMAEEGAAVLVTGRDEGRGAEVVETIAAAGGTARFRPLDVTDEAGWQATVESVVAEHGRLDILFNNAGITRAEPIADVSLETWRQIMAVNADGVFLGTRSAIPAMRESGGGSIINMSSVLGMVRNGDPLRLHGIQGRGPLLHQVRGAGVRARRQRRSRQLDPPSLHPHADDGRDRDPHVRRCVGGA